MIITTVATEITQAVGVYCQTSLSPQFAQIWVRGQLQGVSAMSAGLTCQPDHCHPDVHSHYRPHGHSAVLQPSCYRNGQTQTVGKADQFQANRRGQFLPNCTFQLEYRLMLDDFILPELTMLPLDHLHLFDR